MKTKKIVRTVLAVMLSLMMVLSCASIGVSAAGTVTITFNAYVPAGIPGDAPSGTNVSIGSILNGWDPRNTDWFATQLDSTHFQIKANVSADYIGQEVQYKWTLQRPDDTSKYGYGFTENYVGNRTFTVSASGNTLNDTVEFPEKQIVIDHTMSEGTLEEVTLDMPQFSDNRSRKIRVWLPNGYNANDTGKKYSVLYMHDGQNLFDAYTSFLGEWQVDESMTKLMDSGYDSTIVVGIDNGEDKRFNELSPSWDLSSIGKNHISSPEGEKYAEFIVDTVKPYIDSHYNTYTDCAHTGIGGSSMGGIMSLYMAVEYADVFDYGLVLSPAMHAYNDDVLDKFFDGYNFDAMARLPKLYLFAGGATEGSEAGSIYDEACITKYVDIIKTGLTERNYPAQIIGANVDTSLCHLETTWAKVFPDAMTWVGNTASFEREVAPTTEPPTTEPPTTEPPVTEPLSDNEICVTAKSNLAASASKVISTDESNRVNVTYYLNTPQLLGGVQWQLTYDNAKLKLASSNYDENGSLKIMPVADRTGNAVCNLSSEGLIKGNFQGSDNVYDYSGEGVLVSVDFEITGTGYADVSLDVQFVTYFTDTTVVNTMVNSSEKTNLYNGTAFQSITAFSVSEKLRGDVNCDGKYDIRDAAAIQLYKARLYDGVFDETVADVNNDGVVDVRDAAYIQLDLAKLL